MPPNQNPPVIKSVGEFLERIEGPGEGPFLYRGQSNMKWEMGASALRRIKSSGNNESELVLDYVEDLLEEARKQEHGRQDGQELTDLKLLALLQHHGAATCLIDFTKDPLVALWFACSGSIEENGKVVAISTDKIPLADIDYSQGKEKISDFLGKDKLWVWDWAPSALTVRIRAQKSVFILGENRIEEAQCSGVVEISAEHKDAILQSLEKSHGTTEKSLFCDLPGFAASNAHDRPYGDYSSRSSTKARSPKGLWKNMFRSICSRSSTKARSPKGKRTGAGN